MIGLLAATRTELAKILPAFATAKKEGIHHYIGTLRGRAAAIYLTRPGVASREQLRRFLRLYPFEWVLSTGACANLTSTLAHLDRVAIGEVCAPGKPNIVLQSEGKRAVSVERLVLTDAAKSDLHYTTGADVLDMESYTIAAVLQENEFSHIRLRCVRVVDDLPGEENYLTREKELRETQMARPSGKLTLAEIWRFGMWDYLRITRRRRAVAAAIATKISQEIL